MIIVTSANKDGKVEGHFVVGPPTPGTRGRAPARILPIKGTVAGDRLTFGTPRASIEAALTALSSLDVNVSQNSGRRAQAELKPVWRLVAHHSFPVETSRPVAVPGKPPAATSRKLSAPTAVPSREPGRDGARRGRGGGRGAVIDNPRFPMCSRLASRRGLHDPTPERRRFVRSCVLSG
jgi:hypothetical protein